MASSARAPASASASDDVASILALLPDAVFRVERDGAGRIVWVLNEGKLAETLGITTERVRGQPIERGLKPEVLAQLLPELEAAFDGAPRELVCAVEGLSLHVALQPLLDGDARGPAVVGFISDVTELKRAEARVRELNDALRERVRELAAANRQLEAFNYSVSHDLRNPLNSISLCAQQLARHGAELQPGLRAALWRLQRGVERMDQLIDDVMRLARATGGEIRREPVDLSQIARAIAEERLLCEPSRNVHVTIPDGLTADGDARLLYVVLDNLLGNAIKYTKNRALARIELAEESIDGERVFVVRDNGIGFDMKDKDRIFLPFKRLSDAAGFEGTGVGLATVRRVIDAHGGRIWAEGAPDRGAAFRFTLRGPPRPAPERREP